MKYTLIRSLYTLMLMAGRLFFLISCTMIIQKYIKSQLNSLKQANVK
jgi:hypothetical protein